MPALTASMTPWMTPMNISAAALMASQTAMNTDDTTPHTACQATSMLPRVPTMVSKMTERMGTSDPSTNSATAASAGTTFSTTNAATAWSTGRMFSANQR